MGLRDGAGEGQQGRGKASSRIGFLTRHVGRLYRLPGDGLKTGGHEDGFGLYLPA